MIWLVAFGSKEQGNFSLSCFHLSHSLHPRTKLGVNDGITAVKCHYVWSLNWNNVMMTMIYHKLISSEASLHSSTPRCWCSSIKLRCVESPFTCIDFPSSLSFSYRFVKCSTPHLTKMCSPIHFWSFYFLLLDSHYLTIKCFPVDQC